MDVDREADNVRRKRTMPTSHSNENQENNKTKKLFTSGSSSSSDTANSGKVPKIQYFSTDKVPFVVHVHSIAEDPAELLHPLLISRSLSKIAYFDIKEIKKIGKGKVLAEMASAKAVNDLTNNCSLEKEGLKAYRTVRIGIVKDIPQHFDEADLLKFFDAPCKVVEVRRLNKRIRINSEVNYVLSRTVCLKFAG